MGRARGGALAALFVIGVISGATAEARAQTATVELESTGDELTVGMHGLPGPAYVCTTPCVLSVLPGTYYLETEAPGVRANREEIEVPASGAHLRLEAGDGAAYPWGIILSIFGAVSVAMMGGMAIAIVASSPNDEYNQSMAAIQGGVGGVIGLGSLAAGLALVFSNRTGVEVTPRGAVRF